MRYTLTAHAAKAMEERELPSEWLERALSTPDRVDPDPRDAELVHHLLRIAEHGGRVLRLVMNMTIDPPRVVTVYFDRTMRNRL